MDRVIRNERITLQSDQDAEAFEIFMEEEVMPFFGRKYAGPTRRTYAFLTGQALLKDVGDERTYVWTSVWVGPPERVAGRSFENALVSDDNSDTEEFLRRLDAFGARTTENICSEVFFYYPASPPLYSGASVHPG